MKNYKKNVYSKTYTDQNHHENRTLIVDNVKYQLAQNKKSMIKLDGKQTIRSANNTIANKSAKSVVPKHHPVIVNKYRILKENNYRFITPSISSSTSSSSLFKSFKRINRSKFRLVLKRSNRFKFNKFNQIKINGTNPKRTSLYKKTYNQATRTVADHQKKTQIQLLRKRAVKSSINCLIKKSNLKKNNKLKLSTINTTYCMFYCRFGKCAKIDTCKYKHDPDKVAVCKNFLKGKCEVNGCLLSHKADPKKMPVCSYYLKGICNIDHCPYRHVNVNENAEICKDFIRGFCDKGDQCKLLHQYSQVKRKRSTIKKKISRNDDDGKQSNTTPDLIEINTSNDSNMDISDDDVCRGGDDENVIANNLDYIPLFKDPTDEETRVEEGRGSRSSNNEEANSNNPKDTYDHPTYDYDSDDAWFEDESKNELFQYIPKFLLD